MRDHQRQDEREAGQGWKHAKLDDPSNPSVLSERTMATAASEPGTRTSTSLNTAVTPEAIPSQMDALDDELNGRWSLSAIKRQTPSGSMSSASG
jgi:hypothetical protein